MELDVLRAREMCIDNGNRDGDTAGVMTVMVVKLWRWRWWFIDGNSHAVVAACTSAR